MRQGTRRPLARPLFRSALAVLGLVAISACDDFPGRPLPEDRPMRPTEVLDFDVLYAENCSGCHGQDGTHGAARPLKDTLYIAWSNMFAVRRIISNGVPGTAMPAFARSQGGTLTDAQIGTLVMEMRANWDNPTEFDDYKLPPYDVQPGDAVRGAQVYAKYCARCHGDDGKGGSAPGSIVDSSYLALVSDGALRATVVVGRKDLGMPDWRGEEKGKAMTNEEIADVVAWLASHRAKDPGRPYAPRPSEGGTDANDGTGAAQPGSASAAQPRTDAASSERGERGDG
jgi:cytochrome c oxidase cbb3-type subunit 3